MPVKHIARVFAHWLEHVRWVRTGFPGKMCPRFLEMHTLYHSNGSFKTIQRGVVVYPDTIRCLDNFLTQMIWFSTCLLYSYSQHVVTFFLLKPHTTLKGALLWFLVDLDKMWSQIFWPLNRSKVNCVSDDSETCHAVNKNPWQSQLPHGKTKSYI